MASRQKRQAGSSAPRVESTMPSSPVDPEASVSRLLSEDLMTSSEVGQLLGVDASSVTRWMFRGVVADRRPGIPRRRHYLEHIRAGGRLLTSRQAVERFIAAQSGPPGHVVPDSA